MLLYHFHDWQHAALAPLRLAAEATHAAFHHPLFPAGQQTPFGRSIAASAELFERTTRRFGKPAFNIQSVRIGRDDVKVVEELTVAKPFCRLLHFKADIARNAPRVLLVAPMSGHHSTLLRGTVEGLLVEHDVYVTDWTDAKMVPLYQGKFDLEDFISYLMDFMRLLGPEVHVIGVCQPTVPVLAAAAILAEMDDPAQPRSMTLMGGPIDTRIVKTSVTEFAARRPIEWFRNTLIHALPFYYPGAHRLVYPGFIQLQGFMSMNVERHVGEHVKFFQNLVKGDEEPAAVHKKFYDEYLSVMDVTAEFYLQTVERVFQRHDMAEGKFMWHGKPVHPEVIKKTALLTVEGELDDISAPGQTSPALDLCKGLGPDMKQAHLQIGVGHYGIFNGRKWREQVLPVIHNFIMQHQNLPASIATRSDREKINGTGR
jgi:poly(3-hydroxybutyrate) depolymerase